VGTLTITRRTGETVIVGAATIEVAEIKGKSVRLRIIAPRRIDIARGELRELEQHQQEKR
jgi:carbon storage regulator CsrA